MKPWTEEAVGLLGGIVRALDAIQMLCQSIVVTLVIHSLSMVAIVLIMAHMLRKER